MILMTKAKQNLLIDFIFILISIGVALWLGESHVLERIMVATRESKFLSSLVGGLFFTSIFTTAPAIVILGEIAQNTSIWYVSLFGAIGALVGDLLMFKFLRDRLARDFYALFHIDRSQRYFR